MGENAVRGTSVRAPIVQPSTPAVSVVDGEIYLNLRSPALPRIYPVDQSARSRDAAPKRKPHAAAGRLEMDATVSAGPPAAAPRNVEYAAEPGNPALVRIRAPAVRRLLPSVVAPLPKRLAVSPRSPAADQNVATRVTVRRVPISVVPTRCLARGCPVPSVPSQRSRRQYSSGKNSGTGLKSLTSELPDTFFNLTKKTLDI
jgi:hypothetical protein